MYTRLKDTCIGDVVRFTHFDSTFTVVNKDEGLRTVSLFNPKTEETFDYLDDEYVLIESHQIGV